MANLLDRYKQILDPLKKKLSDVGNHAQQTYNRVAPQVSRSYGKAKALDTRLRDATNTAFRQTLPNRQDYQSVNQAIPRLSSTLSRAYNSPKVQNTLYQNPSQKGSTEFAFNQAKSILRAIPRAGVKIAMTASNDNRSLAPKDNFGKLLLGNEPITSSQASANKGVGQFSKYGINGKAVYPSLFVGSLGLTAADALPFIPAGKGKGLIEQLGKDGVKQLEETVGKSMAKKVLSGGGDDAAKAFVKTLLENKKNIGVSVKELVSPRASKGLSQSLKSQLPSKQGLSPLESIPGLTSADSSLPHFNINKLGEATDSLDSGIQTLGKNLRTGFPEQSALESQLKGTVSKSSPPANELDRGVVNSNLPSQDIIPPKLLPAGQPKVYTPAQAKAIFKRSGKTVPFMKTLPTGDSVIHIPTGGATGTKLYAEGKPVLESAVNKEISEWEKAVGGTKAYKGGKVAGDFPADVLSKAPVKDKWALSYQRETLLRNIEDTFGKAGQKVKQYFYEPIVANETKKTQFVDTLKTDITNTFKQFGIKKQSKEDMAAADLIEGNMSLDQLKAEFPNKWQNIVGASEKGRAIYKDLLAKVNKTIEAYGYDPIPERANYVTHTRQISELTSKFGSLLNFSKEKLPTEMSAINMDTKPGRQFFKFGLQRRGGSTHEGLVTALEKYIEPSANQIYHTADIQRGRALVDYISKSAPAQDVRLSNFNSWLGQYVDSLAGKKNVVDRPFEKVFGRRILSVGNWAKRRTGANMVGANVSSALTNFIPLTQSLATTRKLDAVKGLYEGLKSPFEPVNIIDGVQSGYLTRNFSGGVLLPTLKDKALETSGLLFTTVDKFTKRSVIAGKYYEGLAKGLDKVQAMRAADEYGARTLVDRSYGQVPIIFGSKTLGMFTQFQTEVNNQMSFVLKDIPKNLGYNKKQVASALAQFAVLSYVFNDMYEKVTGRRPQIDLIHLVQSYAEGLQRGESPMSMLNPADSNTPVGEFRSNLPFMSASGGRLPISAAIPNPLAVASGQSTVKKELEKPLFYLVPPTGGGQLKKTLEGAKAYGQGLSTTDNGNVRFPIAQTTANAIKSYGFGQYSVPEARKYFEAGLKPLSDKMSQQVVQSKNKIATYNMLRGQQAQSAKEDKIREQVRTTGQPATENGYFYYPAKQKNSTTGAQEDVVKKLKVSQSSSDIYKNLPKEYERSTDSPQNILSKAVVYGTGVFKDREGTLHAIATGQPIRKVRGDAVVVERLKGLAELDSGDPNTEIDHVIAAALGGDNSESNLRIIAKTENRAKGVVDTYLANLLESGKITKKEAQDRDLNWKNEISNLPYDDQQKVRRALMSTPSREPVKTDVLSRLASGTYEKVPTATGYTNIDLTIPTYPTLTGQEELDKSLKSKYYSSVGTLRKNIERLYVAGRISSQDANDALLLLKPASKTKTPTVKSSKGTTKKAKGTVKVKKITSKIKKPKKRKTTKYTADYISNMLSVNPKKLQVNTKKLLSGK